MPIGSNSAAVIDTPAFYDVDDDGKAAPIGAREKTGTHCEFKAVMTDDEIAACRQTPPKR